MDVYILGVSLHPAAERVVDKRLEEMVFDTARAALADARVSRAEIDHVTIAACDELDGRVISSMLLAAPAGAYLKDEIKCTDSGLMGLCLGALRIKAGLSNLGLVVSWSKSSIAPLEDVMRMRCEPFFTRPIGLNMAITDALFADVVSRRFGFDEHSINARVVACYRRAARNPRGLRRAVPQVEAVATSPFVATPLRTSHRAPITDGAVAMMLASPQWVEQHSGAKPLARITGIGWVTDQYQLDAERLAALKSFHSAFKRALTMSQLASIDDVDVIELESQTAYHEAAFAYALGTPDSDKISPSGGTFAQNPYFCAGLVNAAEAVLQVAGRASPVQASRVKRAVAHSCHGFAQQGNSVVVIESV